ncbi:MAG: Bacterial rane protein YfhO, partial [Chthonomonadales bacterium]|nr:Bacterial rane protein YfhO [Chthonomonadales bacterium]
LDGKPTPIHRQEAAPIFRAVDIPAGPHTVKFTYRPAAIQFGLFLMCAATAVLTFAAAFSLANRRTRQ